MSIDDLNQAIAASGGKWVKLRTTDDTPIEGDIVDFAKRDRTDPEGSVVYKRGTQTPRVEWLFTLATDLRDPDDTDDDGLRKVPCNESMQSAITQAVRASGQPVAIGGRLKIGVKANPADDYKQADYIARYTPPAPAGNDDLIGF